MGLELGLRVYNNSGSTIAKGSAVYVSGAQGQRPVISLSRANAEATSASTLGVTNTSIANGSFGHVTTFGIVHNIDTHDFASGDPLYLSGTTAGGITNVKPSSPNHMVSIGVVLNSHPTQGHILVYVKNGFELEELHNVQIATPLDHQTIYYDSASGLWKNGFGVLYGTSASPPSATGLPDGTRYIQYV